MHFTLFEELKLQYWERIRIVDEKGTGFWGNYCGEYSRSSGTFLFQNSSNGQKETRYLNKLQGVYR